MDALLQLWGDFAQSDAVEPLAMCLIAVAVVIREIAGLIRAHRETATIDERLTRIETDLAVISEKLLYSETKP